MVNNKKDFSRTGGHFCHYNVYEKRKFVKGKESIVYVVGVFNEGSIKAVEFGGTLSLSNKMVAFIRLIGF